MKVLIICSGNSENFDFKIHQAFIFEQIEYLKKAYNIEYDTCFIKGRGTRGYLRNLKNIKNKIREFSPDFIHAHFGLSGLLACLQRTTRVIITFHGSDAYLWNVKLLSSIAARLSQFNIYVSDKIQKIINVPKNFSIVPCGINLDLFYPIEMKIARNKLNMEPDKKYILFASSFGNPIKNAPLAFSALEKLLMTYELIELKNKNRDQVNLLLNACDLLLLTSKSEGSPQIIKEAMACNCPIVATDVGDIKEVITDTEGCYVSSFNQSDITDKMNLALKFDKKTSGREKIKHFDNKIIAKNIFNIYQKVISQNHDSNS